MAAGSLPPGFRFHPTDEELVAYYLKRKINGTTIELEIIPEVDLYKCEPWDLPEKSLLPSKDFEWYFFSPRDRKYPNGSRTNRATKAGYWKATGKDRKVNSEMRSVGMKKTLVYYRGRAPHGTRTGWVMHEYRLDERECPTASGLQDAYALCRIFKKNINVPKVGDHFGSAACDHRSPSIGAYSSDGQYDALSPHSNYPMPSSSTPLSSTIMHGSRCNIASDPRDTKWMQYLSDEAFTFDNASFPNHAAASYSPIRVDMAMECARLQHGFSLPPLEQEQFRPQVFDARIMQPNHLHRSSHQKYNREEIPYVAHDSKNLMTGETWKGNYTDDFSFASPHDNQMLLHDVGSSNNLEKLTEDHNLMSIEIGGLDEDLKADRWMGMLDEDVEKNFSEEYKTVPIENFSSPRGPDNLQVQGECSRQNYDLKNEPNKREANDHHSSLGFCHDIDQENYDFLQDEDALLDDFYSTSNFDTYENTQVNHGSMLVSTRQTAETLYHQVVPSRTLTVHLHPLMIMQTTDSRTGSRFDGSFASKFTTFSIGMFMTMIEFVRPWRSRMSAFLNTIALLHGY